MRVKFKLYNMDLESYSPQAAYYGVPSFQSYDAQGTIQAYLREDGITYVVVFADNKTLHTLELQDVEVL